MGVYTSIHPGLFCCQTASECADYKAECLWFCHVTSCVICLPIVNQRRDWLCRRLFFSLLIFNIQVMKENLTASFQLLSFFLILYQLIVYWYSIDWFWIHTHQVSWAFMGWSADLLWFWVYPTVSRFINVENCKLNPESPNLRFVSCFSNVNIKGPNSVYQELSNEENKLWATSHWVNGPIFALMFRSKK